MNTKMLFRLITASLALFILATCEYEDYPDPIWDPDDAGNTTPTITSIDPANLAYEGVTVVTIEGEDFSSVLSQNQITFNGYAAMLDEDLSTASSLVLTTPVIIEDDEVNYLDSVQVMVATQGAYAGAVYSQAFRVERAVIEWGGFTGELPAKDANAVAVDLNENVYVTAANKMLYKIDSVGVRTEFATLFNDVTTDLQVGPGGYIYSTGPFPLIYRADPAGGASTIWHVVSGAKRIACFDFVDSQNLYCGGKNDSLYVLDIDAKAHHGVAGAKDYDYKRLRVYDGYVYVAGTYSGTDTTVVVTQALWRHEILAGEDTLGTRELVYDWADYVYSADQNIQSLVIDENGLFYIGVSAGDGSAIVTLDPVTKDVQSFYSAVLSAPIYHLTWGNTNYIYNVSQYVNDKNETWDVVQRIAQSNDSAPYYGRTQ